ncbi:MAG: hypothetical protein ACRD1G_18430, partial [Acidimicrobiales bacterium]
MASAAVTVGAQHLSGAGDPIDQQRVNAHDAGRLHHRTSLPPPIDIPAAVLGQCAASAVLAVHKATASAARYWIR